MRNEQPNQFSVSNNGESVRQWLDYELLEIIYFHYFLTQWLTRTPVLSLWSRSTIASGLNFSAQCSLKPLFIPCYVSEGAG